MIKGVIHMHNMKTEDLILLIIKQIKEQKREEFQNIMSELQPYDLAEVYTTLPEKHRHKFSLFLTPKQVATLVQELDTAMKVDLNGK
jgi:magnesium transporter